MSVATYTTPKCGGNFTKSFNGISPTQTVDNYKDSEQTSIRKILRIGWNNANTANVVNNRGRVLTPFRAVNNLGDYLGRVNYVCGGPNAIQASREAANRGLMIRSMIQACDGTNIPAGSGNSKFVADSSDYITFKKQQAINKNYNDVGFGGYNNGSFVPLSTIRQSRWPSYR
jgi:hypothetical protein